MEQNDKQLPPFDIQPEAQVDGQVDPSFFLPRTRDDQTTHDMHNDAIEREEILSGRKRMQQTGDGLFSLITDTSTESEKAQAGKEGELEQGPTGRGRYSYGNQQARLGVADGTDFGALGKSASDFASASWGSTGEYLSSIWNSIKFWEDAKTVEYQQLESKLKVDDPAWDDAAKISTIEKLKKQSPDLFKHGALFNTNVEKLALDSKNELVFKTALHESIRMAQQSQRMETYNRINPHWYSNWAQPFRENVGEGLQDPGFMRDTMITTALTAGFGTAGAIGLRAAALGGRMALAGRALAAVSREAVLLTGPTVGLVEGPLYRLGAATVFSNMSRTPRILTSRAIAMFGEGAITGYVNTAAQGQHDYEWQQMVFGNNQGAFTNDTSAALEGAVLGGFVGIAATGLLRLGLDGVRVGGGMLTTKGRAHYAPRNLGINFQNLTRDIADTFDNWAVTKGGGIVWGDTLSSGRGIAGGDMIDNFLRKNLDQRDFTKILVHGDRLWGQFDPHTVAKMNLDMASAAITAQKFEEATGIAGEAAMRGAAGNQAALVFGSLFDEEQLKNAGLTHANVQDALDLYRVNGPATRQSAAGAVLEGTTKTEPFKVDFDVHATNIGHLMNAVYLDKRFERAGVDFSSTLDVAESHLGRQLSFTSPSDLRTMENLGRAVRGMVVEQQATTGLRNIMNRLDLSTDTQMPVDVREQIITSISGGKTKFFVVDDTDPSYIIHVDTEAGTTTVSTRTLQVDPSTGEIKVVHDLASDPEYKPENIIRADEISNNVRDNLTKLQDMLSAEAVAKAKAEIAALKKAADADPTPEGKAKAIKLETLQEAIDGSKPITIDSLEKVFHLNKTQATAAMVIMKVLGLDENEAGITIAKGVSGVGEFRENSIGQINFSGDTASGVKALIRAAKGGDLGTVTHEMGHYNSFVFLHSKASAERAAIGITEAMYDDMLTWAGATRDTIDLDTPEAIKAQEKIANGWSVYIQMALQGKTSGTSTPITRLFHKLGDHAGDLGEAYKSQLHLDKTAAMTPAAEAVFEKLLNRSANRIDDLFDTAFQGKFKTLSKAKQNEIGEYILGAKMWEDYKAKKDIKSAAIRKKTDPLVKDSNLLTAKEAGDLLIAGLKDHSSRKALSDFRKANGRNATRAEVEEAIAYSKNVIDKFAEGGNHYVTEADRGPNWNVEAPNALNLNAISSADLRGLEPLAEKDGSVMRLYSIGRVTHVTDADGKSVGLGVKLNIVRLTQGDIVKELARRDAAAAAKVEKTKAAVAAASTPDAAVRAVLAESHGVPADAPDATIKSAVAKIEAERALRRGAPSPATTTAAVIDILTEPLPESVPVERAMEVRAEAVAELLTAEPAPTMEMLSEGGLTEASIEVIKADLAALEARVEVTTPAENVTAHNAGTTTPAGPRETRTYVTEDGVPAELTPVQQASAAAHQNVVNSATQAQGTSITQIATAETGTIEELVGIEVGVVPMDHMGVVVINARTPVVAPEQIATAQAGVSNLTEARDKARTRVNKANVEKIEALVEMVKDNPVRFKQIDQILTNMGDGTAGLNDLNRSFFDAQLRFTIATRALNDLTGMSDEELKVFSDVHAKLHGKELTDAQESIIDRLSVDPKNAKLIDEADKIFGGKSGSGAGAKLVVYIRGRDLMAKANENSALRTSNQFLAEPANALKLQTALEKLKTDPNDRAAQTFVGIHEAHQSRVRDSVGGHVSEEVEPVGKVDEFDQPNELQERQKALRTNPLSKTITAEHTLVPDWNPDTAPFDINNPSPQFIAAWMLKNGSEGINGFADILKRPNTTIATAADIANEPIVFNRIVELIGLGNVGRETGDLAVKPIIIDIAFLRDIQSKFDTAYGKRQAQITVPSAKLMETFAHTNRMAAKSGNGLYVLEFMKKAMVDPKQLDNISARLGIDPAADIFTKRAAVEAWARGEKMFKGKAMDVESADRLLGQVQSFGRKAGDREDTGRTAGGLKDRKTTTSSLEPNMDKAQKSDADYDALCQSRAVMSFLGGELHNMLVRTGDTELADYLATRKAIWGQDGDYVENFNNARALRSTPEKPIKPLTKSQLATLDTKLDERIEVLAKQLDKQGHHGIANMARDTRLGVAKGERETTMTRVMSQIDSNYTVDQIRELATKAFQSGKPQRIPPNHLDKILQYPLTAGLATGRISNVVHALEDIAARGGPTAGIAKKLIETSGSQLEKIAVFGVLAPHEKYGGLFWSNQGLIQIDLRSSDSFIEMALLHEAIHAVTINIMTRTFQVLSGNKEWDKLRGLEYLGALESVSKNDATPPGLKLIVDAYLQHVTNPTHEWMSETAIARLGDYQDVDHIFTLRSDQADYASLNINEFVAVSLSHPDMANRLSLVQAFTPNPEADSFGELVEGVARLAGLALGEDPKNVVDSVLYKVYLGVSQFHNEYHDFRAYSPENGLRAIGDGQHGIPFRVEADAEMLLTFDMFKTSPTKRTDERFGNSISHNEKALADLKSAKGRLRKMQDEQFEASLSKGTQTLLADIRAKHKLRVMNQPLSEVEISNIRASNSELTRGQLQGRHWVSYINDEHFSNIVSHSSDDAEFWSGYAPAAIKSVRNSIEGMSDNNPRLADPNWKDAGESRVHYDTQADYAKKAQIAFYHDKWKPMLDAIVNKTTTPDETKAFVAKMQADLQEEPVSIAPDRGVTSRTMNQPLSEKQVKSQAAFKQLLDDSYRDVISSFERTVTRSSDDFLVYASKEAKNMKTSLASAGNMTQKGDGWTMTSKHFENKWTAMLDEIIAGAVTEEQVAKYGRKMADDLDEELPSTLPVFSQIRMESDLKVRANVEGEAGKDVAAIEKRLKDLQDTVESRRRDIRSLGLHEETEPRDLEYILSILNQTPVLQEPHTMDILDRMGHAVPETAKAFRAGKSVINLREMTDDDRREFVTAKMVPTIRRAMGQRITGSFSNSKLGKLSERMIGGAVDYANVANSDSVFLQFVGKLYDPSMDLRNAEIEGMLDIPSVDMANARLNNMYAKSGLMAVRDKAMLVCKTDAELDAANNTAWKYLANRDNLPKDTPHRELVLQTIDAAIEFNREVGELKVKHGLLKESNHLEYGTIRKASEYAYNNRQGFADALHAQALKKAQDAAAKQGEVSLVTAEAMGWVNIRRETHGTDDITHVSIPDDSPLKAVTDLPKEMPWDSRARQAFAVMLPLLSAEAQKQHAEGLVSSKGYKDIWKQATGSRGDNHTALKETMEIAANRYLGIEDLMSSKSAKPRSERTMGGRMYNEDRILTHNEIASNPELAKFFEQNIFGLTHDTLRGDVTDLVMTDMLTDFFGGQVRMPMLDMIEMLNKTGEAYLGKHQLSSKQAKARQAGYNRVKTAWEHHTGRLTRSSDSIDAWYEELLNGARTAVMVASGLGATLGSVPELARAIVSSDSSRSGLAQLLPNLSKVVKLYNKRTAIQECASAAHWIRLMSADNVLAKSDVMPTSPFHGLSYGGRDAGYFNGWKTAWAGVSRMNAVTDSRLGKAMNVFGLASKIPADMLRSVNSYTTTLHIWNAQLNITRDAAKFLQLAEALQKTGPKDLAQFERLAKQCGLRGQEALDLSTAGLLNPVHIKQLIEAGKDQGNFTDGLMDVRKLFDWAKKQDDPKLAEEAINKMGGYIGMTARRSNTEPTLLDVRVNQSAFGRAMNVFMQFLLSHSVQEIGRRRRYNGRNYGKHLVGLFLCEVAAGAMRGYKNRAIWGDDKETIDELASRNPIEAGLYYATSLPTGGSYQWVKAASRQLLYSGYNAASGETVFKERFNMPKLMGSPTESAPSNLGRTAVDLAGSSLGFMKEMMH
jgi:cytochrome c1